MSRMYLVIKAAALVLAVGTWLLTAPQPALSATPGPLPCFAVPSHWTGQQNPDPKRSYHVELRFEWDEKTENGVFVTFLGADGNNQGPFDVKVSVRNRTIVFVDKAQNTFTLRCGAGGTLEAQLSSVSGNGMTPTGNVSFMRIPD